MSLLSDIEIFSSLIMLVNIGWIGYNSHVFSLHAHMHIFTQAP